MMPMIHTMTSKERLLTAIKWGIPDRLPVTTHHVMPYFLDKYLHGMSFDEFFDYFGLDPIRWVVPHKPDIAKGEYYDPHQGSVGFLESRRIATDHWRIEFEELPNPEYKTIRYHFITPKGRLTMVTQSNSYTTWVTEYLVKDKRDIDLIGEYVTTPKSDVDAVNREADAYGARGLIRGHICCFDVFGQPGTWQDACCLVGAEKMIMATYDDPEWVHTFLKILQARKLGFARSLKGAQYDILELGGGDASTTVISPKVFRQFVSPYDREIIAAAHDAGQRVVYHTCGGMMPILEDIAAMQPDAMETFTPPGMGADVNLSEAKRRIGDKMCMIGGFDQGYYFQRSTPEETRAAVRQCFEAAGGNGGYILAPSDHFFDAKIELLQAFADEARKCVYA
jgi:uroporphyrinogen decarboxylase